jgi:hypothetical protein
MVVPSSSICTGQAVRELAYLLDVAEREARQEANPDAAPIGEFGALREPVAVQTFAQVLECLWVADLLNGQDVGAELADHPGELGELAS